MAKARAARTRRSGGRKRSAAPRKRAARTQREAERVDVGGISLSSPERVIYPELDITKLELARYYDAVGEWMLPHLRDRPLALVRCPDDYRRCFYQKHIEDRPIYAALHRIPVEESTGTGYYAAADTTLGVLSLVQLGVVEFHTMGCRRDRIEQPDRFTIDLDPGPDVQWPRIVRAAQLTRELLEEIGLRSFVKTTGGRGLHVVVPIQRRRSWADVLGFTRAVAGKLAEAVPREYTTGMAKSPRKDKILVDYLRNARGSIVVEAYSARARAQATVSTPLHWDELTPALAPESLNLRSIPKRLASLEADPWQGYASVRQGITAKTMSQVGAEPTTGSSAPARAARRGASRRRSSRE